MAVCSIKHDMFRCHGIIIAICKSIIFFQKQHNHPIATQWLLGSIWSDQNIVNLKSKRFVCECSTQKASSHLFFYGVFCFFNCTMAIFFCIRHGFFIIDYMAISLCHGSFILQIPWQFVAMWPIYLILLGKPLNLSCFQKTRSEFFAMRLNC